MNSTQREFTFGHNDLTDKVFTSFFSSGIGVIKIQGTENYITRLDFFDDPPPPLSEVPELLTSCGLQLEQYFVGMRRAFDLPVYLKGSEFYCKVWSELLKIPYGQTISYALLAKRIGNPKSVRAVGLANGKNPVSIIVPCHRVVGSSGNLTGYAGGLERKKWLLDHENRCSGQILDLTFGNSTKK